jgi:ribosomal protein S27E
VRVWLKESSFSIERQLTVSHFRLGVFKRLVPLRLLVGMDALAQWTGDWWQLTPSVFVRARAEGDSPPASAELRFKCPECGHHPLVEADEAVSCPACSRRWAIHQGIYDFKGEQY